MRLGSFASRRSGIALVSDTCHMYARSVYCMHELDEYKIDDFVSSQADLYVCLGFKLMRNLALLFRCPTSHHLNAAVTSSAALEGADTRHVQVRCAAGAPRGYLRCRNGAASQSLGPYTSKAGWGRRYRADTLRSHILMRPQVSDLRSCVTFPSSAFTVTGPSSLGRTPPTEFVTRNGTRLYVGASDRKSVV